MSLKDKFDNEYNLNNLNLKGETFIRNCIYNDVKEAVLKYEEYLNDLDNLGKTISISEFQKKYERDKDRNQNYRTEFKKIFGDFEND